MDNKTKSIYAMITIIVILIFLKFTIFAGVFTTTALIPGVTNSKIYDRIPSNSTLGQFILSDDFMTQVTGVEVESRAEMYGTNETKAKHVFDNCINNLIGIGLYEDYVHHFRNENRYAGVFKNETVKIVFHIFEGIKIKDYTGYDVLLVAWKWRLA